MKKTIFILILLISSLSLHGLDLDVSVSYQPYSFTKQLGFFDDDHDITYDIGQYSVYQAGLKFRSGFNFGFGFGYDSGYDMNDNFVGIISDILAYLGYKQFTVRITSLKTPGTITLTESEYENIAENQPRTKKFNNERTNVGLLYNFKAPWNPIFIGIYYQYMSFSRSEKENGELYHTIVTGNNYGIILGVDSFALLDEILQKSYGFAPWIEGWSYAGAGTTIEWRTNLTLGLAFAVGGKKLKFAAGIGYDLEFDLGMFRHGVIGRVAIKI